MVQIEKSKVQRMVGDAATYAVLAILVLVALLPFLWSLLSSFKQPLDITSFPPKVFFTPTLRHYQSVITNYGIWVPVRTSMLVVVGTLIVGMGAGCPAAYSLARVKTKLTKILGGIVFSMRFLPTVTFALPLFLVYIRIGLIGTLFGLVIAYQLFVLPVALFMMWSFFVNIPAEIEEAARVDGCTALGVFFRIAMPMSAPGLAAALIINAIFAWNHFFLAMILTGTDTPLVTVVLAQFASGEDIQVQWGPLYAWTVIITAPILIFGFLTNKYLISGLAGDQEGAL